MGPESAPQKPASAAAGPQKIDVAKLAERVYQLMHAEAKLDRARGVQRAPE